MVLHRRARLTVDPSGGLRGAATWEPKCRWIALSAGTAVGGVLTSFSPVAAKAGNGGGQPGVWRLR